MRNSTMSKLQWQVVLLCVWLNIIDGIDVMIIAFTASSIANDLALTQSSLAWLISIGLIGMTIGSIWLGPFGDKYGRKPMIILSLSLCGISLFLVGFFQGYWALFILRLTAGIGIGGILSSSNVLCNEYASIKNKGLAVSMLSVGYAIGAVLGGFIALNVITNYGWQTVFMIAGILTLATIAVVILFLHESIALLEKRGDTRSLHKLQAIFAKSPALANEISALSALESQKNPDERQGYRTLFQGPLAKKNLLLCFAIALTMFGFQFVMTWTPKLLTELNASENMGISAGIILSIGGMIGALLVGLFSRRYKLSNLQFLALGTSALMTLLFISVNGIPSLFFIAGFFLGLSLNACVASIYAYAPSLYPVSIRTSGVGLAMGMGRVGGILSPLVAGAILDEGFSVMETYAFYACAFVLALVVIVILHREKRDVITPILSKV